MIQGGRGQMSKRQAVASAFLLRIRSSCNERPSSQDRAVERTKLTSYVANTICFMEIAKFCDTINQNLNRNEEVLNY